MKGIPGRYIGDTNQSRVIYPASKQSWFILLLIVSKILHCVGIFFVFDLLKIIDAVSLTFYLKLISGACFLYIQKPFSTGPVLLQAQWFRIGQYSVLRVALSLLWLYGISLCGPFRSILVTQHYDVVIITAIGALFSGVQSPAVLRGIVLFVLAVISLLFLDHDESQQHPGNSHLSLGVESWFGLADHKLGVIFLCGLLPVEVGANMLGKRVGADIGSQRRLQAFSTILEAALCFPWALVMFFTKEAGEFYSISSIFPVAFSAVLGLVFVYYVDSACSQRFEMLRIARIGSVSISIWALGIASFWEPLLWITGKEDVIALPEQHRLSGGGVFACFLFVLATLSLTSSAKQGTKGSFVGYSSSGLPLYNFTNSSLHQTSKSILLSVTTIMKQILTNRNSRRIFYFLCLNISFTVIEFVYGIWSNSLGLISDGFHMLFDCSALVMGLVASVMACWKPTKTFSYGYGRIEDLSGFVNSLFLLVISFYVFSEAANRILDPPRISTQRLLIVSVAGLIVNLIGIFAFRHGSSHIHAHHGHSHGHGHLHGQSLGFHGHTHNANMEGVFLHIMADTLGSVGVIVSSILIEHFGWYIADPVCSIFIACLIFASVLPLLKQSACVLVLMTPPKIHLQLATALDQVSNIVGVAKVHKQHFWQHSSEVCMGTLHVQATPDASEQVIIQQVCAIFKDIGIQQFCVQVEKEEFLMHLSGLGSQVNISNYGIEFPGSESLYMVKAI